MSFVLPAMSVVNHLKRLLQLRFPLLFQTWPLRIFPSSLLLILSFSFLPIISSSHFPIISDAWSATYYVDATNGNDTNNGLSESTAWKTIAKVNASIFNPGDQILFKSGETWREGLAVPSSGSNGNPITFGAYGSGNKPKITGANSILGDSGDWTNQGSNIWRKNIGTITPNVVIFDATVTGNNNASLVFKFDWRFSSPNLDVYSIGNPTSYYTSIEAGQRNYAIQLWLKSYITIQNLDLRGANDRTIDIYSTNDHHKIQNCNIQNTFMGIVASDKVTGNITIENNAIHDTVEYGILFAHAQATNNTISGNTIYNNLGSGLNNQQFPLYAFK